MVLVSYNCSDACMFQTLRPAAVPRPWPHALPTRSLHGATSWHETKHVLTVSIVRNNKHFVARIHSTIVTEELVVARVHSTVVTEELVVARVHSTVVTEELVVARIHSTVVTEELVVACVHSTVVTEELVVALRTQYGSY